MFYLLFDDVLSVIYKCFRQRYAKISRLLGSFADNFLILQTITNLINRKIDFLSTNLTSPPSPVRNRCGLVNQVQANFKLVILE